MAKKKGTTKASKEADVSIEETTTETTNETTTDTDSELKQTDMKDETISPEDKPKVEPVVAPAIKVNDGLICSYNRGINNYLLFALDTLNTCSVREIDKVIRSRTNIYENFFNAIVTAPSDEEANAFIKSFLNAIHERPYISDKNRALVGFMRLSTLTKQQSNLYQILWKILLDTSNPATRSINAKLIPWSVLTSNMCYHKKGDIAIVRIKNFYRQM